MAGHAKQISVDLRGFHLFDGDNSSSDEEGPVATTKKDQLKTKIKHAQKMSIDLAGYHIFDTNESEDEDEEGEERGYEKKNGEEPF